MPEFIDIAIHPDDMGFKEFDIDPYTDLISRFLDKHTNLQFPKGMKYDDAEKIIKEEGLNYGCPLTVKGVLCREFTLSKNPPKSRFPCVRCKKWATDCHRRLREWFMLRAELMRIDI